MITMKEIEERNYTTSDLNNPDKVPIKDLKDIVEAYRKSMRARMAMIDAQNLGKKSFNDRYEAIRTMLKTPLPPKSKITEKDRSMLITQIINLSNDIKMEAYSPSRLIHNKLIRPEIYDVFDKVVNRYERKYGLEESTPEERDEEYADFLEAYHQFDKYFESGDERFSYKSNGVNENAYVVQAFKAYNNYDLPNMNKWKSGRVKFEKTPDEPYKYLVYNKNEIDFLQKLKSTDDFKGKKEMIKAIRKIMFSQASAGEQRQAIARAYRVGRPKSEIDDYD